MTIAPASQLDAADPLARFRARFVAADDPSIVAYLDGNSLGLPLAVTGDRLAAFVAGSAGRVRAGSARSSSVPRPAR